MGFAELTDLCAPAEESKLNMHCAALVRLILTPQSCVALHAVWAAAWALFRGCCGYVFYCIF